MPAPTAETPTEPVTVFQGLSSGRPDLTLLVLASQGIDGHVHKDARGFSIRVASDQARAALSLMNTYDRENRFFRLFSPLPQWSASPFKSLTIFWIMGLLVLIHASAGYHQVHDSLVRTYGASALYILQGEIYRCVTALFLHADVRHLAGNLAGLLLFCAPVIRLSGFGTGPFLLLWAGGLGNLVNAWARGTAHLSIGASTAVMAGAGLLAAWQTVSKKQFRLNDFMPILAGAVLVAFFSHGEKTDVAAHAFGFGCGLLTGLAFFALDRAFASARAQACFLGGALFILFLSIAGPVI